MAKLLLLLISSLLVFSVIANKGIVSKSFLFQKKLFVLFVINLCFVFFFLIFITLFLLLDICSAQLDCSSCRSYQYCGWCLNEDQQGICLSSAEDTEICTGWYEVDCPIHHSEETDPNQAPLECGLFDRCDECLESELGCKYCPYNMKCMLESDNAVCAVPFITKETESECPLVKEDAGSSLTPFACMIVLLSFLIIVF